MNTDFRQVHRLTPLVKFWRAILGFVLVMLLNFREMIFSAVQALTGGDAAAALKDAAIALGGLAVLSVLVWVLSAVWWRAMGYRLDGEELAVRHGVVEKALRTARYSRIQAVDVVEDFWPRLVGLAAVRVATAGGADSAVVIEFLRKADAFALRNEILAFAHGDGDDTAEAAQAPGRVMVPEIPVARSIGAAVLSAGTLIGAVVMVGAEVLSIGVAALIPVVVAVVTFLVGVVNRSWRYRAVRVGDVMNIEYGLFDRRSQNIPLDRIHGVRLTQPLLWRLCGWCHVQVSVAGYGQGSKTGSTKVLPVGSVEQGRALMEQLAGLPLETDNGMTWRSPRRAQWLGPIEQRTQSVVVIPHQALIVRCGWLRTRISVIALSHIQEVTWLEGPLEQALGLASVRCDVVAGPVRFTAHHLEKQDSWELVKVLRARTLPSLSSTN